MDIPQMEKMSKQDILQYIGKCAKQYVPEWRFDPKHPDAGTALVSIFADLMYDNIKKLNMSVAGDLFSFFEGIDARMEAASPAEGYVVFGLPEGMDGGTEVARGTRLLAEGEQEPLVFETQEEVFVRAMELERIVLSNPRTDAIYDLFDRQKAQMPDFFLFEDQEDNLQRHRLFFCFEEGLEIYGFAEAMLSLGFTGLKMDEERLQEGFCDPARIRFYYGDGAEYRQIADYTYEAGVFQFHIPGGEQGIAPMEALRTPEQTSAPYVIQMEMLDGRFFCGLYLTDVSLRTACRQQKPEFIHVNGTDQEVEEFLTFGERPAVYDECYIGSEEIFSKAGARIELEFDLDFVKIPLEEITAGAKIAWKRIMRKQEFLPEEEYDITVREVIWEYYNGFGWKRLAVSAQYSDIFSVSDAMGGVRRRMEFICPADLKRALVNSADNYCIRARVIGMNNAYKTKGAYIAPVTGNFSLSYSYLDTPLHPTAIAAESNQERSIYTKQQIRTDGFAVPFVQVRPEKAKTCYFGFANPPVGGPLKLLFVMQDAMAQKRLGMKWEYWSEQGWRELHPTDGTEGFAHTGLLSWYGRNDVRRKRLFGGDWFWMRLCGGNEAGTGDDWEKCPKIKGIYPNAVSILGVETIREVHTISPRAEVKQIALAHGNTCRLTVHVLERGDYRSGESFRLASWTEVEKLEADSGARREFAADRRQGKLMFPKYMDTAARNEQDEIEIVVQYEYCQGEKGNVAAGEIRYLDKTIGLIDRVFNPMAAVCGCEDESVLEAVKRNAGFLRHGGRCISAEDYEDLAREAVRDLRRVKCFAGYDPNGQRRSGAVTLAVLPADYGAGAYSFARVRARIYEYLSARMDPDLIRRGQFQIVMPELIRLDVKVRVELSQEKELFDAAKRVREKLERFLDALKGNFYQEGWEIGELPNQNQIVHALKQVKGVRQVRWLSLRKYRNGRFGAYEVNEEQKLPFYHLPQSGFHEVDADFF